MIVGWVVGGLQALLAVGMGAAGVAKLLRRETVREEFERYGYSMRFMLVTGATEALAATGLLVGLVRPVVAVAGAAVALGVLTGALVTHARVGDPLSEAAPAVGLFLVATIVTAGTTMQTGIVGT
jgi:uncharacterized membrane protein